MMRSDIEGAIRKLKALQKFYNAKGAAATTFNRAIETMERAIVELEKDDNI
jgi:hypothetical protein